MPQSPAIRSIQSGKLFPRPLVPSRSQSNELRPTVFHDLWCPHVANRWNCGRVCCRRQQDACADRRNWFILFLVALLSKSTDLYNIHSCRQWCTCATKLINSIHSYEVQRCSQRLELRLCDTFLSSKPECSLSICSGGLKPKTAAGTDYFDSQRTLHPSQA